MWALVTGYVAASVITTLYAVGTAGFGRALGAQVEAVCLFVGPPLVRLKLLGAELHLGAVPIPGSYVTFVPLEGAPSEGELPRTSFDALSRLRRVAILLSPWVVIALATIPILSPVEALESIGRGFVQLFHGALQPFDVGAPLLASFFEIHETEGPLMLGARLATKLVAFNLLPLSGISGGLAINHGVFDSPQPPRWLAIGGLVLTLGLAIGWGIAALHAVGVI